MDHRCLYGHRVPGDFRFAIERNACPTCGAELVSLDGYKLARALVTEAQLDAVTAFRTAKVLERRFVITPREQPGDDGADSAESAKPTVAAPTTGEASLDQEDLTDPSGADVATPSAPLVDELEDAESVELISTDTDEQPAARRQGDTGFDAVEESFFSSSP